MKSTYNNLSEALSDLRKLTNKSNMSYINNAVSNEFIGLNAPAVPYLSGTLLKSIPINTDYDEARIAASTPYVIPTYEHNITGQDRYFEYTAEKYNSALTSTVQAAAMDVIERI